MFSALAVVLVILVLLCLLAAIILILKRTKPEPPARTYPLASSLPARVSSQFEQPRSALPPPNPRQTRATAKMRTTAIDASQLRVTGCLGSGVNGIAFSAASPSLPTNVAIKVYDARLYGPIDGEGSEVHALQVLSAHGLQRNTVQFFGTTCMPIAPLLRQPSRCSDMINRSGALHELAQGDASSSVCAAAVVTELLEGMPLGSALAQLQGVGTFSLLGARYPLTRSSLDALQFGSSLDQAQRFHAALARVQQTGPKELEAFVRPGSTSGWDVLLGVATALQYDHALNLKPQYAHNMHMHMHMCMCMCM